MSDVALLLGPVAFEEFEIPACINFGGEQRLIVHRLPGGARVIDALGRDDADISFSGIFSGSNATLRARTLDTLRAEGLPLPLTWDVFFYTVVIRSFEADYRSGWWIPYKICCTVLRDEAGALIDTGLSLAASIVSDVSSATIQALIAGIDLSGTQSALSIPGALTRGSAPFANAGSSMAVAQASVQSGIEQSNAGLLSAAGEFSNAASAQDGIAAISAVMQHAEALAPLTIARGFLGRAALNLANASS